MALAQMTEGAKSFCRDPAGPKAPCARMIYFKGRRRQDGSVNDSPARRHLTRCPRAKCRRQGAGRGEAAAPQTQVRPGSSADTLARSANEDEEMTVHPVRLSPQQTGQGQQTPQRLWEQRTLLHGWRECQSVQPRGEQPGGLSEG